MNRRLVIFACIFSPLAWLAVGWLIVSSLSSCQSNKDSDFPKLTEAEKQAFAIMNQ